MPEIPKRGEIWRVDLGYLGKVRPVLVLNIPFLDHERALAIVVAHTTSLRNTRFEVALKHPALKQGAFDAQQIFLVSPSKFEARLGVLTPEQMKQIENVIAAVLGLSLRD